ncbi:RCC1 and BTB domain-containing protein 1, variant 3 [Dermatophagoides farinae]|uniref:RCC1 and BTB domain-containing protein 1, variant 3 n=1 Tax=Dermatophagoides farinae TaxID=6954 RepID=A0A922HSF2_DERFA|nr:RCC1 and BTB domain-containing protein 1, variant 3 [Dermatophagoides farinae]
MTKLDNSHSSFASASTMILSSPLTFGLTSTIDEFKSHDPISYQCKSIIQLFDNQDSYDVEFLIDKKRIKACKCYLKSCFSSSIMARSPTESIDIELFQDDFKNIDQEFLQSVISIFSFFPLIFYKIQFLLMTKEATYAYGKEICSWLSLEDDMEADSKWEMINHMIKPQRISCLDDMKIVQVDYGHDFVAILTDDGRVYLASDDSNWKTNKTFRLISNDNDRFKMIACGGMHLLLLRQDGHVFAMGNNCYGQITGNNEKSSYESMVHIDKLENVKLIVCGMSHNFSLTNNGEIYSWGSNDCGQLGLGDNEDRDTPCLVAFSNDDLIDIRIKDIVAGRKHSLFLFENGQLWGCGSNSMACKCYLKSVSEYYRRMFSGNWSENDQVTINDYSYETYYAYLRMLHTGQIYINRQNITELVDLANCYDDETLMKCCEKFIWNDLNEQTIPTYLPLINKYEMKVLHNKLRNMKDHRLKISILSLFKMISKLIYQEFLQSVVSIFSFFTFKDNEFKKQFLLMTKEATYAYGKKICSWLSLQYMGKPKRISLLNGVKIVQHDVIGRRLLRQYALSPLKLIGIRIKTLRLISNDNDRFKMIACGHYHLLLLRQDGHVFAMGIMRNVKLIACGWFHSLSITNKGEIYSWGSNDYGQLGLGDEKKRNTPCLVAFPNDDLINIRIKDILWGCGSNRNGELGLGDDFKLSNLTKIPIENVQQIACSLFHSFSLAYDGSSYYAWGKTKYGKWSSPRKLDNSHSSFASASTMILSSPLTFGLTSTIDEFESHDPISYQCKSIIQLFDNQDSYDVEFLIDKKRIKACKCYLKSVSEYYRRMFSGNWIKKDQVPIQNYSYETYYAYVHMLHTGKIHINHQNITELVDLANCYSDERLMEYCETFIRNDLDEQTMPNISSIN